MGFRVREVLCLGSTAMVVSCASAPPAEPSVQEVVVPPTPTSNAAAQEPAPLEDDSTAASDDTRSPSQDHELGPLDAARVDTARTEGQSIGNAVQLWLMSQGADRCPTYDQLIESKVMSDGHPNRDPWGNPYAIECGDGVTVTSAGPDERPGTADDVSAETH